MTMARSRLSFEAYFQGIRSGNKLILSKAITLIESKLEQDRPLANQLINALLPYSGQSIRIGITGVPGAGKSTFIEAFGEHITAGNKKIAVLAIDPSSKISGGSILGDKTRMDALSRNPLAFIRPSPAGKEVGGVANKTLESIILCEAAGFEVIVIETVGVGQSETMVKNMVDFFMLLVLTGAGDELQGIKRGIMEMADGIVINKADGDNIAKAGLTRKQFESTLHLFPLPESEWTVPVMTCSSLEKTGIAEIREMLNAYKTSTQSNGYWDSKRQAQKLNWMTRNLENLLLQSVFSDSGFKKELRATEEKVRKNELNPNEAADYLFRLIRR